MTRVAALLFLCVAACQGPPAPVCGPGAVTDSQAIEPGSFAEAELVLEIGATVSLSWSSDGALAYDIHVHDGDVVTNLVEGVSTGETLELVAERDGPHYPLFANSTDDPLEVVVDVELGAGACWNSWL